jgi:hypothetical protein
VRRGLSSRWLKLQQIAEQRKHAHCTGQREVLRWLASGAGCENVLRIGGYELQIPFRANQVLQQMGRIGERCRVIGLPMLLPRRFNFIAISQRKEAQKGSSVFLRQLLTCSQAHAQTRGARAPH